MSRKEAIFDCLSTKEDIVDDFPVYDEDNIEDEVSEVTVMEIDNFRNECMRETEDYMNRRLIKNHEEESCVGLFPPILESYSWWWIYLVLLHIVLFCWANHTVGNNEGGD